MPSHDHGFACEHVIERSTLLSKEVFELFDAALICLLHIAVVSNFVSKLVNCLLSLACFWRQLKGVRLLTQLLYKRVLLQGVFLKLLIGALSVEQKTFELSDPTQRDLVVTLKFRVAGLLLEKDSLELDCQVLEQLLLCFRSFLVISAA